MSLNELQNETRKIRRLHPFRIPIIVNVSNEWTRSKLPL